MKSSEASLKTESTGRLSAEKGLSQAEVSKTKLEAQLEGLGFRFEEADEERVRLRNDLSQERQKREASLREISSFAIEIRGLEDEKSRFDRVKEALAKDTLNK